MSKLKIKSPGQNLQIKARLVLGEAWNRREQEVLQSQTPAGFMRLETVSGKTALYSAPADMTLEHYMSGGLDRETFFRILLQLVNILRRVEHLHLSAAKLELDPRWIFIACRNREMFFLYQPLESGGSGFSMQMLLVRIANAAVGHGTEPAALTELRRIVSFSGVIKTADLERLIVQYKPELAREILFSKTAQKPAYKGTVVPDDDVPARKTMDTVVIDGTMVIDDDCQDDGTVVLDEPDPVYIGLLKSRRTGETVRIDQDVFRIGRSRANSDYCLEFNPAVSREHADISRRKDRFFVFDKKTPNGTFINGSRIPVMRDTPLTDGCELRLANEDFIFHIVQE